MLLGYYQPLAYLDDEDLLLEIKARPHVMRVLLGRVPREEKRRSHYSVINLLSDCLECTSFVVESKFFCC